MIEQVVDAAQSEQLVRVVFLDEGVEEQRQVVMVVQLFDLHLTNPSQRQQQT